MIEFAIGTSAISVFISWLIFGGMLYDKYHFLKKTEWICTKSEIVGDEFPKIEIATQWTKKGK